jgi:ribonuclease D
MAKKTYTTESELLYGDLPVRLADRIRRARFVAWDIETSGLDWRNDAIGTCQVHVQGGPTAIIRMDGNVPRRLVSLLSDPSLCKVFHHAMFDLRFMVYKWKAAPRNVACTKIASKLLDVTGERDHGLQSLLKRQLGVEISKDQRLSNWLSDGLTGEQIAYASNDVMYLVPLLFSLEKSLDSVGLLSLAQACFEHLPTRVQLDISGYGDIYRYSSPPPLEAVAGRRQ